MVGVLSRGGGVPRKHQPGWRDLQLTAGQAVTTSPTRAYSVKIYSLLCRAMKRKKKIVLVPRLSKFKIEPVFPMFVRTNLCLSFFFFLLSHMKTQAHHHLQTGAKTNTSRCCNGKANAVSSELPNQTEVNLARHVRIQKPSDFIPFLNLIQIQQLKIFLLKSQVCHFYLFA